MRQLPAGSCALATALGSLTVWRPDPTRMPIPDRTHPRTFASTRAPRLETGAGVEILIRSPYLAKLQVCRLSAIPQLSTTFPVSKLHYRSTETLHLCPTSSLLKSEWNSAGPRTPRTDRRGLGSERRSSAFMRRTMRRLLKLGCAKRFPCSTVLLGVASSIRTRWHGPSRNSKSWWLDFRDKASLPCRRHDAFSSGYRFCSGSGPALFGGRRSEISGALRSAAL